MVKRRRRTSRRGPVAYGLEVPFEAAVQRVETRHLRGMLGWLRRWRRGSRRVFWEMDPVTGDWHRL
jgi:hypothetical protein